MSVKVCIAVSFALWALFAVTAVLLSPQTSPASVSVAPSTPTEVSTPSPPPEDEERAASKGNELTMIADAFCSEVEHTIMAILPILPTRCIPTSGKVKDSISGLIIYEQAFFDDPEIKKLALLLAMASAGRIARMNHVKLDEVVVSDVATLRTGLAFRFPGSAALSIQRRMENDEIGVTEGYRQLIAVTTEYVVTGR